MNKTSYPMIERIMYLMINPDVSIKKYMEKWEVSRRTYFRDKMFIQDRMWQYKVVENDR